MKCPKCHFENPDDSKFCKECGTQIIPLEEISPSPTKTLETPTEELTTGSTFAGRYQIIEELGKGGMGKVYKAHDTEIKEKVALKLLKPEIAADEKTIERFRNEIRLARKIVHKNVGRMYDLSKADGTYFITMEYVEGQDLRGLIRQSRQLTVGTTINIAKQVCEGLEEAHRLDVVHRDLKPQNIMIDKEGNARIMDFGIARFITGKGITGAGVMIGTPEYMSPEQVEGKEVDQRSDIYSLGVILYEMVTGRVPFEGDTPLSIAVKHKTETPKEPRELNTQIPEDLSRVILRCMEKDKEKRYQSAGEVSSELTNIEKGIPTTERVVPKRKPITSREITVTFGLKKLFIPGLVVAALVIAAVIIWQLFTKKEAVLIPSDKPSLAVMYFKNNTGDESLDHWRTMLSDLLIQDLFQSKYIRVLSEDRLLNILEELNQIDVKSYPSKVLKEVAVRGRVNHILQGNYAKAGDIFRINVTLQNATTMEIIASEGIEGKGQESIFSMVDELTKKVKTHFKLSSKEIASDIDKEIGEITTSSPEAYRYYYEGIKYDVKGDYNKVIEYMEKAVAIDPEFALAYLAMSWSYGNMGYFSEQRKCLQKALELSDRLSDRERYLIQGHFYAPSEKTYDKAIEALEKLLKLYPDDLGGNNSRGILYEVLEEFDKAIERYGVPIKNKSVDVALYGNQARAYNHKGLYDKAIEILEYYLNNISDSAVIHRALALTFRYQGNFNLALEEIEKASALDPAHFLNFQEKGDIFLCKGDMANAEREYKMLLSESNQLSNALGVLKLSNLYYVQGRFEESKTYTVQLIGLAKKAGQKMWEAAIYPSFGERLLKTGNPEEALEKLNKAQDIAVEMEGWGLERRALSLKGLAYIKMKSFDKARKAAEELRKLCQKSMNKKLIRMYYHLVGMIELESGNYPEAIESFKKAISLDPNAIKSYLDSLALAYYRSGNLEKARSEYGKIISYSSGIQEYEYEYVKSFYTLGKIFEELGNKAKAIEHYEKFLAFWKDADPGIAEVEDAKKRVAGLKE